MKWICVCLVIWGNLFLGRGHLEVFSVGIDPSPVRILSGIHHDLWFSLGWKLGYMTQKQAIHTFIPLNPVHTEVGSIHIAVCPDDSLAFSGDNYLAHATTSGHIRWFGPWKHTEFLAITCTSQGDIWATDAYQQITWVSSKGLTHQYALPQFVDPHEFRYYTPDMVQGPDGAIWLTSPGQNLIMRFDTHSKLTTWPAGIPVDTSTLFGSSIPTSMSKGSDGTIWYIEQNQRGPAFVMGRILHGKLSPVALHMPTGIWPQSWVSLTIDLHGSLWIADTYRGSLLQFTSKGVLVEEVPLHVQEEALTSVTTGMDGSLWFTNQLAGQIGRYIL